MELLCAILHNSCCVLRRFNQFKNECQVCVADHKSRKRCFHLVSRLASRGDRHISRSTQLQAFRFFSLAERLFFLSGTRTRELSSNLPPEASFRCILRSSLLLAHACCAQAILKQTCLSRKSHACTQVQTDACALLSSNAKRKKDISKED